MKKKTAFILFGLLISANLYSQQFKSGTLYFSDSTKLRGNIKYDFSKKKVKYQKEWRAKVKSFKKADISKFDIEVNNRYVTYYLKKIKELKDPIHIRPIIKGAINLYLLNTEDFIGDYNTSMSRVSLYYIEKKEGIIEGPMNYRKLKKFAPDYFNDCVSLMDKIKAKEYKDREIIQIVKYYNTSCK